MSHPADGVLRRLVDEPDGVPAADRLHVRGCATCTAGVAAAEQDAAAVAQLLGPVPAGADLQVDAAWHRLARAPQPDEARPLRSRRRVGRPAVAALAVAVVLAGAGTAAAYDWLPVFRTERVAPVALSPADLVALPDLRGLGTLVVDRAPRVREVDGAAAARAAAGVPVPRVAALPRGVHSDPVYRVGSPAVATFTFSSAQAARSAGAAVPSPPPGVEGSRVRLTAGPGVVAVWSSGSGAPALVVARAVAPSASSSGAPFAVVRDHLLSLPGLDPALAAQLRTLGADGGTLPLPVPAGRVRSRSATVDGVPATLLQTRDGALAAVVWVRDGLVTVVGGSLDDDEVLRVARDLR